MAAEITKKKLHLVQQKKGKISKFETRFATLTADSLTFYKKATVSISSLLIISQPAHFFSTQEPFGSELIPTEKISGAEQKGESKGKFIIQITVDKEEPLLVATDTAVECDIWTNELKRCKARK